ncbi:hypothetical protein FB451DRAFT_1369167 [Mycena latifolia]|nr:hypothetical protein FB451DRAFT_1369167 [Mycena latifolia]
MLQASDSTETSTLAFQFFFAAIFLRRGGAVEQDSESVCVWDRHEACCDQRMKGSALTYPNLIAPIGARLNLSLGGSGTQCILLLTSTTTMGGTLWACGPGQTPRDISQTDDGVSMYYRYSGFIDFKGIILNATIAFLTALSGKQISKKLLIDEGVVTKEAVEELDEAIVIANYRSRIDAAISLLKSWLNTKSGSPPEDPILKMFGGSGSRLNINPMSNLGRLLDQRAFIAEIMAEVPIDFNVVNPKNLDPEKLTPPHTLTELRLAGIHAFILFPDNDGTLSYEQAKEVERLLRMLRPYCVWDEKWGAPPPPEYQPPRVRASAPAAESDALSSDEKDGGSGESAQVKEDGRDDVMEDEDEDDEMDREDEQHFIDEMITVFAAVPPGGEEGIDRQTDSDVDGSEKEGWARRGAMVAPDSIGGCRSTDLNEKADFSS